MNFGIPYMGSKSKICKNICALFPKADHFYDLFGGGFSITHFMIKHRSKDYKHFHFNEIRNGICDLIKDAISGKYNYKVFKPKWISREEFFEKKELDPYIKMCWSFGNNGTNYLFGDDIEAYKRSMHHAVVFNEFDETSRKILGLEKFKDEISIYDRRLYLRNRIVVLNKNMSRGELEQLEQLQRLQRLERLQQLERLQRLEQLERLQRLEQLNFYNTSYEKVDIKENSVIYCDIPYDGTGEYDKNKSFNRKEFLNWAHEQINPFFISEYNISDSRFKQVYQIEKRSLLSSDKYVGNKLEKVYVNKSGYKEFMKYHFKKEK